MSRAPRPIRSGVDAGVRWLALIAISAVALSPPSGFRVYGPVTRAATRNGRVGPLRVANDGRYLIDAQRRPFLWLADTPWTLFVTYPREDVITYLDDRAAKGFKIIQAVVCWRENGTCARNVFGQVPFVGGVVGRPNAAYFEHVRWIIDEADRRGIIVALLPIWSNALIAPWNTIVNEEQAGAYGRYLGERFSDCPNIVWVLGGDTMVYDKGAIHRSMAAGIKATDASRKLVTFHPSADSSAGFGGVTTDSRFNPFGAGESVLDLNMGQSWGFRFDLPRICFAMYNNQPVKPGVLAEGTYERADKEYPSGAVTPELVRREAWWAHLSGVGYSYGNMAIWEHTSDWRSALNDPGALSLTVMREALEARRWWRYTPTPSVLPSDLRPHIDNSLPGAIAAASDDGDGILVYFGQKSAGVLSIGMLTASTTYAASWIHPGTGQSVPLGDFANVGRHSYATPSGWPDAVLAIDTEFNVTPPSRLGPRRAMAGARGGLTSSRCGRPRRLSIPVGVEFRTRTDACDRIGSSTASRDCQTARSQHASATRRAAREILTRRPVAHRD